MKIRIHFIACLFIILGAQINAQDSLPLNGKKILYTYGGWHGHEPDMSVDMFLPWLKSMGAKVDTFTSLEIYTDSVYMASVDLIIQIHTMSKISNEQEKGLINAVKAGAGIAGWHGGLCDAFRNNVNYQFMTGGQWVAHPGGRIESYEVNITDTEDPVTAGIKDFTMTNTEQYYMHVDPFIKVLATTTFNGEHAPWIDGAKVPVIWKKMYGQGRVFYSSLGHVMEDLEVYEANITLKRGIIWASESREHANSNEKLLDVKAESGGY